LVELNLESERAIVIGFSNLLRQSFRISIYSFMELWLLRECYLDGKHKDGGKSYNELKKHKGLEKVRLYHQEILQSNFDFGANQDWLWLNKFKLLQDCIVHRQGSLSGFSDFRIDSNLKSFVQSESGLSLIGVDDNQVFIDHSFYLKALQTIHKFMLEFILDEKHND
jgi:hypothetical protein